MLSAPSSFEVEIIASKLEPLLAPSVFTVDIEATADNDPHLIDGAVLWLDMSDAGSYTESGGFLDTYTDKVSEEVYTTAADTTKPGVQATGFNGQPTLNFDGSNDRFLGTNAAVLAAITDGASHTLYVVCHPDVVDGNRSMFGWGTAADATANSGSYGTLNTGDGRLSALKINSAGTAGNITGAATPAELTIGDHVFCSQHDGVAHTTTMLIDDGTPDPDAVAHEWGDVNPDRFGFGCNARATVVQLFDGQISEMRLYPEAHDAATITAITAHLVAKWGL